MRPLLGLVIGLWLSIVLILGSGFGVVGNSHGGRVAATTGFPTWTSFRRLLQLGQARIVGGDNAPEGRFPYMLSLRNSDTTHQCGAVLVHSQFALTAAHCVHPDVKNSMSANGIIAVGAYGRGDDYTVPGVELIRIKEIFPHPKFIPDELDLGFDIALVQLDKPTDKTPIPLPSKHFVPKVGSLLVALGWGSSSINLQRVDLTVTATNDCTKKWRQVEPNVSFHSEFICAWNATADTCQGDSGGPLLVEHKLRRVTAPGKPELDTLAGITSFGDHECRKFKLPGVYTAVAKHVDWIEEIIETNSYDQPATKLPEIKPPTEDEELSKTQKKGTWTGTRFTYIASLQNPDREHQCMGVLVDTRWILTVAQCVSDLVEGSLDPYRMVINIGGIDAGDPKGVEGELTFPEKTIIHSKFDGDPKNGYNIALIKLPEDATQTPPRLPPKELNIQEGQKMLLLGWNNGVNVDTHLQAKTVKSIDLYTCNDERTGWNKNVKESMVCTEADTPETCGGDMGSPLLLPDSPKDVSRGNSKLDILVGLYSYGDKACKKHARPAVHVQVRDHLEWIKQIMEGIPESSPQEPQSPFRALPPSASPTSGPTSAEICGSEEACGFELYQAAEKGDLTKVKLLLEAGVPAQVESRRFAVPLIAAAKEGHTDVVGHLLDAGAIVDFLDNEEQTALMRASANGHFEAVEILLAKDADPNGIAGGKKRPLGLAASANHTDVVELLLDNGAEIDATNDDGETALYVAAYSGSKSVVELLVERGANSELESKKGVKPVKAVCSCKLSERSCPPGQCTSQADKSAIFDVLDGALPSSSPPNEPTAIGGFSQKSAQGSKTVGTADSSAFLSKRSPPRTPTICQDQITCMEAMSLVSSAVSVDNITQLEDLMAEGYPTEVENVEAELPLHLAVINQRIDAARILLKAGANVDVRDENQNTPLMVACRKDFVKLVNLLIENGANPNAADRRGQTPLIIASSYDSPVTVQAILNAGGLIDLESPGGGTALYFAAFFGSAQALDVLMTGGADARIAAGNGLYPSEVICLCADDVPRKEPCSVSKCGAPEDTRQIATYLEQALGVPG